MDLLAPFAKNAAGRLIEKSDEELPEVVAGKVWDAVKEKMEAYPETKSQPEDLVKTLIISLSEERSNTNYKSCWRRTKPLPINWRNSSTKPNRSQPIMPHCLAMVQLHRAMVRRQLERAAYTSVERLLAIQSSQAIIIQSKAKRRIRNDKSPR